MAKVNYTLAKQAPVVKWVHDDLRDDLDRWLGEFSFRDLPLGSVWMDRHCQKVDLMTINPSFTNFNVKIYEIKVARTDFLGDVGFGKWKGYLNHSNRLFFATPEGLVRLDEIPDEAGWIVRKASGGWVVMKRPKVRRDFRPSERLFISMIVNRQRPRRDTRLISLLDWLKHRYSFEDERALTRSFGRTMARLLARINADCKVDFEELLRIDIKESVRYLRRKPESKE